MRELLVVALAVVAASGFAYRLHRLRFGGPIADVAGQALLGVGLGLLALAAAHGVAWARWVALGFAVIFAVVVMPVWVLAVLIPLRPGAIDLAFTVLYWAALGVVAVAAVLA